MNSLDLETRECLRDVAARHGTPCFVYFPARSAAAITTISTVFGGRFEASYAIKCNPNLGLLRALRGPLHAVDASSIGEVERALHAGYEPGQISFSGPGKRLAEIERAVELGIGALVCESPRQLVMADSVARSCGRRANVLLRINPLTVPKGFGLHMGGRSSQFGIDEEVCDAVITEACALDGVDLAGFHVFSAGNSLQAQAVADNLSSMITLFRRLAEQHDLRPRKLVFGAGFGIPYFADDQALDLDAVAAVINPQLDLLRAEPRFAATRCMLEMGRWLVGPHGYLLTTVVGEKHSRGTHIRICDAGFNTHLSACGMMGTVLRRNWQFTNLSAAGEPDSEYLLVGPLCASFDQLAAKLLLPATGVGDIIAVGSSGAYGLSASPLHFISHPAPREWLLRDADPPEDVSEFVSSAFGATSVATVGLR